jgi:hypothetical protein
MKMRRKMNFNYKVDDVDNDIHLLHDNGGDKLIG